LNDIVRHRIASRETANHTIHVGEMLRDGHPDVLINGH